MEQALEVLGWSEQLRQRPAAEAQSHHLWPGLMSGLWQCLPCRAAPGMECSSGSRPCLLPLSSWLWDTLLPRSWEPWHGMDPSWPTCVCPYPINQLWRLHMWRDKSVGVCLCQGSHFWKIPMCGHLFPDLLWVQSIIMPSVDFNLTTTLQMTESGESMMTAHTAILSFKSNSSKRGTDTTVHFTKRHVIHPPIDLEETSPPFSLQLHNTDTVSA